MKQIIIVIISLIFVSCAGLPFPPESTGKTAQTHTFGKEIAEDNRWIDMEDIIELITYSDTGSVKVSDVIRFLGEPVYIERYDNEGKIQTDLHYKFKTKLYPTKESRTQLNKDLKSYTFGDRLTIVDQIKPSKVGTYNSWEKNENWVVVVSNSEYFEIIFTSSINGGPKLKKGLDIQSLRINNQ